MQEPDPQQFHRLYGAKKPRMVLHDDDFIDYTLMTCITALIIVLAYGRGHVITTVGMVLCACMVAVFPVRHGIKLRLPVILRRPQDALYMLFYKLQGVRPVLVGSLAFLLLENFVIGLTPHWPHQVELMRQIALGAFYLHLIGLTAYRTVILVAHLRKAQFVRQVLLETPWQGHISRQRSIHLEILHAYATGLLTHIVLLAPWFIVVTYSKFSVLFLPVVFIVNVLALSMSLKTFNAWFYRDHWLGHNSELEFIYLHGTHHDAIPSGLIAVSGNGHLEGFLRHTLGVPTPLYSPLLSFLLYGAEVYGDIRNHQFIPGVFPRQTREFHEGFQHSVHHFLKLEPYSIALRDMSSRSPGGPQPKFNPIPEEIADSISLDEQLTGFQWDNPQHRRFLALFDKYQS
jgi:hypothetical protein